MLISLAIRDVVLIEALDLHFGQGLGVLTGETGAGKSILLDALGLALGARGDAGLVRQGATQAVVTATFDTPHATGPIATLLGENGFDVDPGEPLMIRRIVKADGGSRAFVNDQPASAGLLRELATYLVEIHGQHDDRGLLNPRGHRALLDAFGRIDASATATAYKTWRDAETALATAHATIDTAARDREWLEHAVAELRALAPEPGEEEALAERRRTTQRSEKIAADLAAIEGWLEGSDGGLSQLRQAARVLERIAEGHEALAEALAAVDRAVIEGAVAEEKLREAKTDLWFDPAALEEDEARLFELRGMARKHRVQPDALADLAAELAARLEALDAGEEGLAALEAKLTAARTAYDKAAATLSAARTAAALRLDAAVKGELVPLKLDAARFRTVVAPAAEEQWSAAGKDRVEFEISTNQGAQATAEELGTVDTNFFDLMRFPAVEGDPTATIADPDGLVITQSAARKYFGSQPAIGQTLGISVQGKLYAYRVGAVLRDMPANVTFKDEMFAQIVPARFASEYWDHWGSTSLTTLLRFPDETAARAFEAQLPAFLDRHAYASGNLKKGQYFQTLRPLTGMHLYTPGDRAIVTTLAVVGVLTLLIAIVNYVNLATARAGLRAREVAMRKVLGGTRRALVLQFLGEAVATVAMAALTGLALAEIALPFLNALGGTTLAIHYGGWDSILLPMLALVLGVALVAGLYPAFVLSSFRPAAVLASARAPGGGRAGARLRGALVVFQFAIAIAFAITTAAMLAQTAHIRDADLGFRRDGLMIVRSFRDPALDVAQRAGLLSAFAALPGVTGVTVGNNAPGDQNSTNFSGYNRPGTPDQKTSIMVVGTGQDYFRVYGARLLAGRLFDAAHADDRGHLTLEQRKATGPNIVLNRTAVKALGFAAPTAAVGQTISDGNRAATIIGVIDDVRFKSPRDPVDPTAYTYNTVDIDEPFAVVRYTGIDPKTLTARLEAAWKRVAPGIPFKARSVEDNLFERYYKEDAQRSRLFTIGAVLAVLIGCIGLYGLAAFDTARRVKEIGIRKTLGASTAEVLRLLIGQFLRPVLLANLVAWPLAFVALQRWLGGFDDRIALSPLFFLGATLVAVLIAAATVFGQAWRVARAEPARALRYE